ncbi:MAG: hypothetical protein Kapaf2KO_07930 [Candidatus Kapaibacteriales bacterium]
MKIESNKGMSRNLSKEYFTRGKAPEPRPEDLEILRFFEKFAGGESVLEMPQELFDKMTPSHGVIAKDLMKGTRMFRLPQKERQFYSWLYEKDRKVWEDIWGVDETPETTDYSVSMDFLPLMLESDGRGFPICDLEESENFFFMETHLVGDEGKTMMETSQKRFIEQESLTVAQLLALEISIAPIDIWHFAYKHGLDVEKSKQAAKELAEEGTLVHLTDAEHLAPFINF